MVMLIADYWIATPIRTQRISSGPFEVEVFGNDQVSTIVEEMVEKSMLKLTSSANTCYPGIHPNS